MKLKTKQLKIERRVVCQPTPRIILFLDLLKI
jgi:hypothetical protein